jgi:hypothetical protein
VEWAGVSDPRGAAARRTDHFSDPKPRKETFPLRILMNLATIHVTSIQSAIIICKLIAAFLDCLLLTLASFPSGPFQRAYHRCTSEPSL